jgi:hypothetical protein
MTPYMTNFIVISNIIQLKAFSCNEQITKDKYSFNVWRDTFHPIVINDKS